MNEVALPATSIGSSHRPSVVIRLVGWIDSLPAHGWWFYPLLVIALFVWGHGILWAMRILPVGTIDPTLASGVVYGPYILAAIQYLNGVAERSLADFWPATGWPEANRDAWAATFRTSPASYDLPSLVIGVAIAIGSFLAAPAAVVGPAVGDRLTLFVAYAPLIFFGYSMLPFVLAHNVRQLRLVARIHREAQAIDPFDRVPLYAFSRFTVQTGLAYLLSGYYTLTVNWAYQEGNPVGLAALAGIGVIGVACFVVPLWGIHGRLAREKANLLAEVEVRMHRLGEELYRRIDAGAYDSTKVVSEGIAGVAAIRDRIERLPTWPWQPQLFRGFVSALFLPVIVYLLSRLIAGRIGA